jgi:DNA polymerase III sliding clamp (beta) subunit (PCNA family)
MSAKINRESFLHTLESVWPGVAPRAILEQSDNFVFKKGRVLTFNDEISCKAVSGLPKDFTGAVEAQKLLDLLRKLSEEELTVAWDGGSFALTGKRRGAEVRMEAQVTLPVEQVERPETWTKLPANFLEAVGLVQQCAGKDASQFRTVCVHLHPDWVEASDDFQLARYKIKTGLSTPVLVRQTSIKHVVSLGFTEMAETNTWLHFRNGDVQLSCRRYLNEGYDLTPFLKIAKGKQIQLPKGIVEACDKALIFAADSEDKQVTVHLRPGKLRLEGIGAAGRYWEAKKVTYDGPPMKFSINPDLLSKLVTNHPEAEITPDRICVRMDNFVYLACLSVIKENDNGDDAAATDE